MLAQKHRPYQPAGSTVNPSPAPWVAPFKNVKMRTPAWWPMIAMSSRFAAKPTIKVKIMVIKTKTASKRLCY